ncbi:MAG TPA: hypothetical protein VFB58_02025 [Chloroflexota bacterium]|nr:hypothetical protein [Chloroflexota bacterium]
MGRETRQARRARQRKQKQVQTQRVSPWAIVAGGAIVAIVIAVLAISLFNHSSSNAQTSQTSSIQSHAAPIDGIKCEAAMTPGYHIHTALEMYVDGKHVTLPPYVGFNIQQNCLYWLHVHEPSYDIIHLESPGKITPTLGTFFNIWHEPLSWSGFWKYTTAGGKQMKVYVDGKPYLGNPRSITITQHKVITLEIGPPFVAPKPVDFTALGL